MSYDTHPSGCECGQCVMRMWGPGLTSEQQAPPRTGRLAAVYLQRSDGDWDCQCVFDTENRVYDELWSQGSGAENAADEMVANMVEQGETAKVVFFNDWSEVVDVLEDGAT